MVTLTEISLESGEADFATDPLSIVYRMIDLLVRCGSVNASGAAQGMDRKI